MPWYITVPGLLAAAVAAWFLLLPIWMGRLSVQHQIYEAFDRERAIRASGRAFEEVSR